MLRWHMKWDVVELWLSEVGLNLHVKMHQNQAKFVDLKKIKGGRLELKKKKV